MADTVDTIRQLEKERYAAMLAGDVAALERLLDPGLVYMHSSGVADTKQSYVDGVRSKRWEYKELSSDDQTILVRGDTALVFNRMRAEINVSGTPRTLDNRTLAVWSRGGDGAWRMLALQSTPVPK